MKRFLLIAAAFFAIATAVRAVDEAPSISLQLPKVEQFQKVATVKGEFTAKCGKVDRNWCKIKNPFATGYGPFEFNWGDREKTCAWFPTTHKYAEAGEFTISVSGKNTCGLTQTETTAVKINFRATANLKCQIGETRCVGDSFQTCEKIGNRTDWFAQKTCAFGCLKNQTGCQTFDYAAGFPEVKINSIVPNAQNPRAVSLYSSATGGGVSLKKWCDGKYFQVLWGDGEKSCENRSAKHFYDETGKYEIAVRVQNVFGLIAEVDEVVDLTKVEDSAAKILSTDLSVSEVKIVEPKEFDSLGREKVNAVAKIKNRGNSESPKFTVQLFALESISKNWIEVERKSYAPLAADSEIETFTAGTFFDKGLNFLKFVLTTNGVDADRQNNSAKKDFEVGTEDFCRDSDGGTNPFQKGFVEILNNRRLGQNGKFFDYCANSQILVEQVCENGEFVGARETRCEAGCANAVCADPALGKNVEIAEILYATGSPNSSYNATKIQFIPQNDFDLSAGLLQAATQTFKIPGTLDGGQDSFGIQVEKFKSSAAAQQKLVSTFANLTGEKFSTEFGFNGTCAIAPSAELSTDREIICGVTEKNFFLKFVSKLEHASELKIDNLKVRTKIFLSKTFEPVYERLVKKLR